MNRRPLGKSGLECSEIGLGCWQLGGDWGPIEQQRVDSILAAADDAGISFWDTADVYGGGLSEQRIGDYQRANPSSQRVIVTKAGRNGELYPDGYQRDALRKSIEGSLQRLQVNQLDLVQLHCIPFSELRKGDVFVWLEEFRQEGLIRHYGASVETCAEAMFCLEQTNVASLQIIFNVLRQDMADAVLPLALEKQVGIIVRLGLASGLLTGKMKKHQVFAEQDHRNYNRDGAAFHVGETFSGLPYDLGVDLVDQLSDTMALPQTVTEWSLRWLLDHEAVSSVIVGASSPEQVRQNASVSQLPPLSDGSHQKLQDFYQSNVRGHIRGEI